MLEAAGAQVDAIEANRLAFMRCLVTREILGLTRSKFWLGDFMKALENWQQNYDLIVASGVLYHLESPLHFLELAAKRTDALYLWTHVVTTEPMRRWDLRRVFGRTVESHHFHGIDVRAYRRTYANAPDSVTFCGGLNDEHRWLHRDDLLKALKVVGFEKIRIAHEQPDHPHGPALSIFARK